MASVTIYYADTCYAQGKAAYISGDTLTNATIDYGETKNITVDDGTAIFLFVGSGNTPTVTDGESASVETNSYGDILTVIPSDGCDITVSGT